MHSFWRAEVFGDLFLEFLGVVFMDFCLDLSPHAELEAGPRALYTLSKRCTAELELRPCLLLLRVFQHTGLRNLRAFCRTK